MSVQVAASSAKPTLKALRWPRTIVMRFVARRTLRSATFVALALGVFVSFKVLGYVDVYPTLHDRLVAMTALTSNIGFKALFGMPHSLETAAGYASWYGVASGVLLGGIWAYLVATRALRGEEAAGRWELMLAGQTMARRAALNALLGLSASLVLFYAIVVVALIAIGKAHGVDYAAGPSFYFALACVSGAAMFMAVGAFASQLMATRAKAAGLATAVFGISFLARVAGDVTSAHWLQNVTPLGWVEQLQPLVDPHPLWLLPIAGLTLILAAGTVLLAGMRDLGDSFLADRDTARPRTLMLRGPFTSAIRLTRATTLSWILGIEIYAAFFGSLAASATQVFSSTNAQQVLNNIFKTSEEAGVKTFLGVAFFMFILLLMAYAANAVAAIRSDEAQGYLDNLLVRPVSRLRWLWSRILLVLIVMAVAGLLTGVVMWLFMGNNHHGVTLQNLLVAGINSLPAAIFTLGVGVFAMSILPRLTSVITYGVIAWSFLIELLGSGTKLNHWLLDTSVFNHVAFAPAVDPKWTPAWILMALGALLMVVGSFIFNRRDLAPE